MTTQPADEDILIQAARAERGQHRSGASMAGMLGVAIAFGVVGCLLIFVPRVIAMLLPGPLSLLGGFSVPIFITLGIIALGIAGFFLLAAFASSPLASSPSARPVAATTRLLASPARAARLQPISWQLPRRVTCQRGAP